MRGELFSQNYAYFSLILTLGRRNFEWRICKQIKNICLGGCFFRGFRCLRLEGCFFKEINFSKNRSTFGCFQCLPLEEIKIENRSNPKVFLKTVFSFDGFRSLPIRGVF